MDLLDSLERAINEIDALEAIYGANDGILENDNGCNFSVSTKDQLESARLLVSLGEGLAVSPPLEIEIRFQIVSNLDYKTGRKQDLSLRCQLPPGYPEIATKVSIVAGGFSRSIRDEIVQTLQEKANEQAGQEAVMYLVDEFKELVVNRLQVEEDSDGSLESANDVQSSRTLEIYSRRWIWVHHIKDSDRRKAITAEARNLDLDGFLKSGYPGVMVIEGRAADCDDFVSWVKGNKSRPGGFGRNWGHHVRGHIDFDDAQGRKLTGSFEQLVDMADLGRECKIRGLEEEFLEYVLQHRVGD